MNVNLGTITVTDEIRRCIRRYYGKRGLATRKEVRDWWNGHAETDLNAMCAEYEAPDAHP